MEIKQTIIFDMGGVIVESESLSQQTNGERNVFCFRLASHQGKYCNNKMHMCY